MTKQQYLDKLNEDYRLGRISEDKYQTGLAISRAFSDRMSTLEDDENQQTDCSQCSRQCIHRDAFRRLPKRVGGLALCPNLK
jgi:hypothetical protein